MYEAPAINAYSIVVVMWFSCDFDLLAYFDLLSIIRFPMESPGLTHAPL